MKLNNLQPAPGARHRKKRIGRGTSSGWGKTSGKGMKGQNSRSGGGTRPGFEGGQTPLFRRIPKRGFHSLNRDNILVIKTANLDKYAVKTKIDIDLMKENKMIPQKTNVLRIVAGGKAAQSFKIKCNYCSPTAKKIIEKSGGSVQVI